MLTGGALDADAAVGEAVLLRLRNVQPALLGVLEDIAVGGLLGEGADRAGAEDVVGAKELLGVFVRTTLILAGEVQVDIRHLVASEAEEGLERDIEALLLHLRAALGADLVRHVGAAAVALAGLEVRVLTMRADIVRGQGVDLRDAGEIGHERRADAPSAADEVAVLERIGNELLGGHVDDVVPAGENVVQLGLDRRRGS